MLLVLIMFFCPDRAGFLGSPKEKEVRAYTLTSSSKAQDFSFTARKQAGEQRSLLK